MFAPSSFISAAGTQMVPGGTDSLYCLANALDEISEGAIFLNTEGQLIWHNRAFDKLMVDNREGHLLVAAVIDLASDLCHDPQGARPAIGSPSQSRTVKVGGIAHEIRCTLMPKGSLGSDTVLLSVVRRSASRWSSYEQHLRTTFNLTEREAQVAVECLQGKKNLEIAEHLKISVETVNKHLDKVYQKAGVRGRAELASRLLDSAF
ncbi:MAG TPA: helix-turn-helix transcriptional regulator [Blastocatellia bacterium]|nr:helix-turn-helix transcriptional regulator [Blastocatellia bacterium]